MFKLRKVDVMDFSSLTWEKFSESFGLSPNGVDDSSSGSSSPTSQDTPMVNGYNHLINNGPDNVHDRLGSAGDADVISPPISPDSPLPSTSPYQNLLSSVSPFHSVVNPVSPTTADNVWKYFPPKEYRFVDGQIVAQPKSYIPVPDSPKCK